MMHLFNKDCVFVALFYENMEYIEYMASDWLHIIFLLTLSFNKDDYVHFHSIIL